MAFAIEQFNIIRIRIEGLALGQKIFQQRDYIVGVTGGAGLDSAALLQQYHDLATTIVTNYMNASYSLRKYWLGKVTALTILGGPPQRLDLVFGAQEELSVGPAAGIVAEEMPALQVDARISRKSSGGLSTVYWQPPDVTPVTPAGSLIEKKFPGRLSWGPLTASALVTGNQNFITGAFQTNYLGVMEALRVPVLTVGADSVSLDEIVISGTKAGVVRVDVDADPVLAFQTVQFHTINPIVGTQDRRTPT